MSVTYSRAKRAFDLAGAVLALLVLSPVFVAVSPVIALTSPGGVLFRHQRVGLNGRQFLVLKFRTMRAGAGGASITSARDPRITAVGRWMRRYKLDELPQLINVLRGEMSLVGPRPEVRKYVDMYPESYATILSVRPGLTDYAAIAFRHEERLLATSDDPERMYAEEILPRKIELYLRYIQEMSLATDLRLIAATLRAVAG